MVPNGGGGTIIPVRAFTEKIREKRRERLLKELGRIEAELCQIRAEEAAMREHADWMPEDQQGAVEEREHRIHAEQLARVGRALEQRKLELQLRL